MYQALFLLLLLPSLAFGASIPAGFPSSSLWLSKLTPTVGEVVTIHTVVYNSSTDSLSGSVVFLVDDTSIGSKPFTGAPGTTQIVSHPWTATEGAHVFSARIDGVTGSSDTLEATQSATTSITVAAPPPVESSGGSTSAREVAGAVKGALDVVTPTVSTFASTTINAGENIRASAIVALEKLASSTTPKATTEISTPEENVQKSFDVGATIQNMWQALLAFLLMIFRSSFWFYVFVAGVLFLLIAFVRSAFGSGYSRR